MRNLNKEESEQYIRIVKSHNMDIMADYAYTLGWKDAMAKVLEESKKFANPKS